MSGIVEADMLAHSDVIILWNVVALYFLGAFTDYWQFRSFDFEKLNQSISLPRNSSFRITEWHWHQWQNLMVIHYFTFNSTFNQHCSSVGERKSFSLSRNETLQPLSIIIGHADHVDTSCGGNSHRFAYTRLNLVYLYEEHVNLIWRCNELSNNLRRELMSVFDGYDGTKCFYTLFNSKISTDYNADIFVLVAFAGLCVGSAFLIFSLICGTIGALRSNQCLLNCCAICLIFVGVCQLFTIVSFIAHHRLMTLQQLDQNGDEETSEHFFLQFRTFSFGYSFIAFVCCFFLIILSTYMFIANSTKIKIRKKSMQRRDNLERKLINFMQPNLAISTRKKVEVKIDDPT